MSVSFVDSAVQLYPELETPGGSVDDLGPTAEDIDDARVFEAIVSFQESSRFLRCGLCAQQALFAIPDGLRCDEHAWQAAAHLDWVASEPWVPIRIDRSNA